MKHSFSFAARGAVNISLRLVTGIALSATSLVAQTRAEVTLTRLDCGTGGPAGDVGHFSDTYEFAGVKIPLTYSCYLIKHGNDYLIWDTGNAMGPAATAPKTSLVDLVAQLKVTPAQVKFVGISHYHGDHMGQARQFPQSTLLIGKGDWDIVADPKSTNPPPSLANWISGGGKADPVTGDRDVFGDSTVIMLNMPGHTPGHHSLLVRLRETGNVLISGDLTHFRENYASDGVPVFNSDRSQSLASIDRFKKIAKNLKALVIIQHDPRDVGKLPAFPAAAR